MEPYNLFSQQKRQYYPSSEVREEPEAVQQHGNEQSVVQTPAQTVAQPFVQTPAAKPQVAVQTRPSITSMDDLAAAIGYTSPEQEERLRKANVMNQRILAIGDALRHIGNIANTVNYAPSQQFNDPVAMEQARYEKGKTMRDKANQLYYTYQQQKAAQDAAQRKWEQQFKYNMAKDARDYELKKSESEARNNLREAQLDRYQTMIALDEARREGIISDNEYKKRRAELYPEEVRSRIAKNNRSGGGRSGGSRGGGSNMPDYDVVTTYDRDDEGRVKSSRKTRTVKHANGTTSTNTKTTQPKKKALPGQTPVQPQKPAKKRLPGT